MKGETVKWEDGMAIYSSIAELLFMKCMHSKF